MAGEERPSELDVASSDKAFLTHLERVAQKFDAFGIGGYRALQALDLQSPVYHMNEGHATFLALEKARRLMETGGLTIAEARQAASAWLIFTTHTPVPAGRGRFSPKLMDRYFGDYARPCARSSWHRGGRTRKIRARPSA